MNSSNEAKDFYGNVLKVGDMVVLIDEEYYENYKTQAKTPVFGEEYEVVEIVFPTKVYKTTLKTTGGKEAFSHRFEKINKTVINPTGGPSSYYDHPFKEWVTVNDMVEYFSQKLWGSESWIFKDILKAVTRWGEKEGTTKDYDARKIIYYGLRLLRVVSGKKAVADYLKELSNNEQFQG